MGVSTAQLTASDCLILQYQLLSRAKQCNFLLVFAAPAASVVHACLLEGLKSCLLAGLVAAKCLQTGSYQWSLAQLLVQTCAGMVGCAFCCTSSIDAI